MKKEEYGQISYKKLFRLMERKKIKRIDLREKYGIHSATIARLNKDQSVNIEIIAQLCEILKCQPGQIMEYVRREDESKDDL